MEETLGWRSHIPNVLLSLEVLVKLEDNCFFWAKSTLLLCSVFQLLVIEDSDNGIEDNECF